MPCIRCSITYIVYICRHYIQRYMSCLDYWHAMYTDPSSLDSVPSRYDWSSQYLSLFFFFQAEDGIRDLTVTGVQTCALPISTGLAASAPTSSSLTLSWRASTDSLGVTGYRVYRNGTLVASPNGTSVSITGLSVGVPYSFTVSALDVAGNVSALSAPLSVTLQQILWSAGME